MPSLNVPKGRMIVLLAALVVLCGSAVLGVVILRPSSDDTSVPRPEQAVATLTPLHIPIPPPVPRFTRTTYAVSDLDGSLALLDRCKGPVAVWLGLQRPTLIAEHDYCGGSAWMSKVKVGDAVQIGGDGVDDGIFVVTSLTYETRNEVTVGDLPDADAVLQTCVSKTRMVLAGLERFVA